MKRTNRIEPININANKSPYAVMTITTQMEIIRRVEVTPMNEGAVRLQSDLDQSLAGQRISTDKYYTIERSQRTLCFLGCLFITAGLLALSVVIAGLAITFRKTNAVRENDIDKYDLGDLHYGINNINQVNFPSNTYLSNMNKLFIEKYFSEELVNQSGYRGLVIDSIFVRKQRDSSCSIIFIIQNIQVYFDHCSTCITERNLALRRSFTNITSFRQPFYLISNNFHIFLNICSTPNLSRLIVPIRLNISMNSTFLVVNTNVKSIPSLLKPRSQIPTTMSGDITTNLFKRMMDSTTTIDNLEESISFTTDHLSTIAEVDSFQTSDYLYSTYIPTSTELAISHEQSSLATKNAFQKPTASIFQFLPFRPSTTRLPRRNTVFKRSITQRCDNLFAMIKIITNQQRSSTLRPYLRSQATSVTHDQSTILQTSISEQSIMPINSAVRTENYRETSSSSSTIEADLTTDLTSRHQ